MVNHTIEIKKAGHTTVFELAQTGRTFKVVNAVVRENPDLCIGFNPSSADEVLDTQSDAYQVFDISTKVKKLGCTLALDEMRATDIETLTLALKQVKLQFWLPENI